MYPALWGRAYLKQKPRKNQTMKRRKKQQVEHKRKPLQGINQIEHTTTTTRHRPNSVAPVGHVFALVRDRVVIGFKSAQSIDSRGNTGKRCKGLTTFIFSCFN